MGLIEDFSELPLKWILIICVVLKIGLIVCLCGTDLCTSGEPTEHYKNQAETENNQQQVWLLKYQADALLHNWSKSSFFGIPSKKDFSLVNPFGLPGNGTTPHCSKPQLLVQKIQLT